MNEIKTLLKQIEADVAEINLIAYQIKMEENRDARR